MSRPLGGDILSAVARRAEQTECSVQSVLTAAVLIALADFSGTRELRVGTRAGGVGSTATAMSSLSIKMEEGDTLRTLTSRLPAALSPREPAGNQASDYSADRSCPIVVAVDDDATGSIGAPGLEDGLCGQPLELAVVFGLEVRAPQLVVHYADDLYEAPTVEQLVDHVLACLDALLVDPDRPVAAAMRPPLQEALGFLAPEGPDPGPGALHMPGDLVRSWVIRTPDATAILAADGASLTYGQLGAVAGALAERLKAEGDGRDPVAVLTADSRTAAIAMVACQFADRCFVMLDPDVPATRNTALVATARCGVILHDEAAGDRAADLAAVTALPALLYEESGRADVSVDEPRLRTADDVAAYIAFTSGTTGAPKGVVQPRRSFTQFVSWQQAQLRLGPGSRVAMWSSPVFDACYMEVFGALAYGATLCVPPPGERRNPEAVAAWLSETEVTFFQGIPSFIEYVVAAFEARPRPMDALENVIVAGEVFPPALAGRMHTVFPSARVHNMFGPTECVLASRHEIPAGHPANRRLPVGRPITGRRLLLMDAEGRPVPRGAVGEIGIVSPYLSSGYIGDEARTSSRFRPLPGDTDEVVYHTGDFGRVGHDGELRYLGRRDAQIKVRGVRVNLDEIEAVLSAQPQVGHCKVVDVRVAAGHVQLVAFVHPEPGVPEPAAEYALADQELASAWRRSVTEALGARVAPTRFVVARQLPQTATGKPDLVRMRQINEDLRTAKSTPTAAASEPTPPDGLRDRIRRAAQTVTGRPVRDDEDLLESSGDPLLLAVRLKKALRTHCPGAFDDVDVRVHRSVDALDAIAVQAAAAPGSDA